MPVRNRKYEQTLQTIFGAVILLAAVYAVLRHVILLCAVTLQHLVDKAQP